MWGAGCWVIPSDSSCPVRVVRIFKEGLLSFLFFLVVTTAVRGMAEGLGSRA